MTRSSRTKKPSSQAASKVSGHWHQLPQRRVVNIDSRGLVLGFSPVPAPLRYPGDYAPVPAPVPAQATA